MDPIVPIVPIGGSPIMGGAGAPPEPALAPIEAPFVPPFVPPLNAPPIENENSFAVEPISLDMQPGDFRFITMRESCRSIYKSVYLSIKLEEWDDMFGLDLPAEHIPDADLGINAREERRRFNEIAGQVFSRVRLGGYGERGLAHSALEDMLIIAKLGWRGYIETQIARQ